MEVSLRNGHVMIDGLHLVRATKHTTNQPEEVVLLEALYLLETEIVVAEGQLKIVGHTNIELDFTHHRLLL